MKEKIKRFKLLLTGFYHIERCPVCGHLYLGTNSICKHCNYEPLYDNLEEYKAKYKNK